MTAQPAETLVQHDVIHLGGETAAEADAVLEAHREWVAAGRPGALSHEEAMAELFGGSP